MKEVEQELLLDVWDELTQWVDLLSFREIRSNEPLVRSIELFEQFLGKRPITNGRE